MNWKKIGLVVLVAFLIFFLVRSPVESANALESLVRQVGEIANAVAVSLTTFLRTLF